MKHFVWIFTFWFSAGILASPTPSGETVLQILFKQSHVELTKDKEPLCDMSSFQEKTVSLGAYLGTILSPSFDRNHNLTHLKGQCRAAKYEIGETLIDSWECDLQITETNTDGEYITGSTIIFSLNQHDLNWLSGSLRCF